MKKVFYFITAVCAVLSIASCELKDDKEYFDENAALRSQTDIERVQKVLQSKPNGWVMQYYGSIGYGGYNVMVKFDGDEAIIASEKLGTNHLAGIDDDGKVVTSTSHYKLEQSMGTVISFDEYNPTFHYFSMPDNPDGIGSKDEGFYGDFEFRVMKCTPDSIVLSGKKHQNRIYMLPIPTDRSWESIITDAKETEDFMSSRSYTISGSDVKDTKTNIRIVNQGRCLVFTYRDSTELMQTVYAPYIVEKDGFEFYNEVNVNGMVLDGLLKGDTDEYFLFKNNPNIQLNTYVPSLVESLTSGTWFFRHSNLGPVQQPLWDNMIEILKTAGTNKTAIKLRYAMLGQGYDNTKVGVHMIAGNDDPYYGMRTSEVNSAGDQVKISLQKSTKNKTGEVYYKNYGWDSVFEGLFGRSGRTYKLTTDYIRKPKYITLTDINDPTNVFTVWSDVSYFMDDDPTYYNDN